MHCAKLVQARCAAWKAKGLRLLFLPPYSPHLNRIETLWRLIKHRWLPAEAYANFDSLWRQVTAILAGVGTKYHITFPNYLLQRNRSFRAGAAAAKRSSGHARFFDYAVLVSRFV